MPSAKSETQEDSSRSDNQQLENNADAGVVIRQLLEKKIRNLEKRRSKLVQLKEDIDQGKELHPDQKKAAKCISQVDDQIDFSRDMLKNVIAINQNCQKLAKAEQRRENKDRAAAERARLRDLMNIQELLNMLGSEDVRNSFVKGIDGSVLISNEKLVFLDHLYQKICPSHDDLGVSGNWKTMLDEAVDCANLLINKSPKLVPKCKISFKDARALIDQIAACEFYQRRTNLPPDHSYGHTGEGVIGMSNADMNNAFASMTLTNGRPSTVVETQMTTEAHLHSRPTFIQEDQQAVMGGAPPPFGAVGFVPVGMSTVYPLSMGNIYTQAPLPIPSSHVVFTSNSVDVCQSAVESMERKTPNNVTGQQAFSIQIERRVEEKICEERPAEEVEDDFSGFQDVRSSRSKMRRDKSSTNEYSNDVSGKMKGGFQARGRGPRRAGPPARGRRRGVAIGSFGDGQFSSFGGGNGMEGTIGRWEDQDFECATSNNRGGRGRSTGFHRGSYGHARQLRA